MKSTRAPLTVLFSCMLAACASGGREVEPIPASTYFDTERLSGGAVSAVSSSSCSQLLNS